MGNYERKVGQIQKRNEPILKGFQAWLVQNGLAPKTVKNHISNIEFFIEYLISYEPLSSLEEANGSDVYGFLMDWYPRKAMWASKENTKSYMATFRKYFKYLVENKLAENEVEEEVREIIKEK